MHQAAQRYGLRRMFGLGLRLAQHWSHADLPAAMDRFTSGASVMVLAETVQRGWFAPPGQPSWLAEESFRVRCLDTRLAQLVYSYNLVFSVQQPDRQSIPLPLRLYPLYSFLRPARLVLKYAKKVLPRRACK